MTWKRVSASEIEETIARDEPYDEIVPRQPAIYAWRRLLRPPPGVLDAPTQFLEWVEKVLSTPVATIRDREISHYAILTCFTLGGQGLSPDKIETLKAMAAKPKGRRYLAGFLNEISDMLPAVYAGETDNLYRRVREHISGESGLLSSITLDLHLAWRDLELWYWALPAQMAEDSQQNKSLRTLLEMIATRLAIAPYVRRIG